MYTSSAPYIRSRVLLKAYQKTIYKLRLPESLLCAQVVEYENRFKMDRMDLYRSIAKCHIQVMVNEILTWNCVEIW